MTRYQNWRARRSAPQAEPAVKADTNEFRAPTVELEDKIFTIGTTADAAKFEVVKEELGKHFATQSWSDGVDASMSFDTLTERNSTRRTTGAFTAGSVCGADCLARRF